MATFDTTKLKEANTGSWNIWRGKEKLLVLIRGKKRERKKEIKKRERAANRLRIRAHKFKCRAICANQTFVFSLVAFKCLIINRSIRSKLN